MFFVLFFLVECHRPPPYCHFEVSITRVARPNTVYRVPTTLNAADMTAAENTGWHRKSPEYILFAFFIGQKITLHDYFRVFFRITQTSVVVGHKEQTKAREPIWETIRETIREKFRESMPNDKKHENRNKDRERER